MNAYFYSIETIMLLNWFNLSDKGWLKCLETFKQLADEENQ